jgi:hypothetical protein
LLYPEATEIDRPGDQPLLALFDVLRRCDRNDHVPDAFGLNVRLRRDPGLPSHPVAAALFPLDVVDEPARGGHRGDGDGEGVPTLPEGGVTWSRTLMVPVIDEWMAQW